MASGGERAGAIESYLEETLYCPICFEVFKEARILPCKHKLCGNCCKKLTKVDRLQCPACRRITEVNQIKDDALLNELAHLYTHRLGNNRSKIFIPMCKSCSNLKVSNVCQNCESVLCKECSKYHRSVKNKGCTKEAIVTLEAMIAEEKENITEKYNIIVEGIDRLENERNEAMEHYSKQQRAAVQQIQDFQERLLSEINKFFDNEKSKVHAFTEDKMNKTRREYEGKIQHLKNHAQMLHVFNSEENFLTHVKPARAVGTHIINDMLDVEREQRHNYVHKLQIQIPGSPSNCFDSSMAISVMDDGSPPVARPKKVSFEKISNLLQKEWIIETACESPSAVYNMLVVGSQLWCLLDKEIHVRNCDDLNEIIFSVSDHVSGGRGLAAFGGHVITASLDTGLQIFQTSGNYLGKISDGKYTDVTTDEDSVYAVHVGSKVAIEIYGLDNEATYAIKDTIVTQMTTYKDYVTIGVRKDFILLCSNQNNTIYRVEPSGILSASYGDSGGWNLRRLCDPSLCGMDSSGHMLIADFYNHRFQVLEPRVHRWSELRMRGSIEFPRTAVYTGSRIYIAGCYPHRIYFLT